MVMTKFLMFFISISFVGCAAATKDTRYMSSEEYQQKPSLAQGFSDQGKDLLSEADIQKVLTSKVVLPKSISLAVIRLQNNAGASTFQIDDEIVKKFYDQSNWGNRVRSVIPVPRVMVGPSASWKELRQAAALLQANALLIISPETSLDTKFMFFEKDKARATTTLEVILMDTRTGAAPFTTVTTESIVTPKDEGDFDYNEFRNRAKRESEKTALFSVPSKVEAFSRICHEPMLMSRKLIRPSAKEHLI